MQQRSVPEMMRAPLDIVVLHSKMLELYEEPKAILALALSPPNLNNIENTIWHLKEVIRIIPKVLFPLINIVIISDWSYAQDKQRKN